MMDVAANVAGSVSYNIGTLLAYVWDVSNEALSEGDWTGMWKLTLLTSCLNPIGRRAPQTAASRNRSTCQAREGEKKEGAPSHSRLT